MSDLAEIKLWGRSIGAISQDAKGLCTFEYEKKFQGSGMEISPVAMPLSPRRYSFPSLAKETFHGLPGLLADSLPDKFGNTLINAWLATQDRTTESFNAIERLCYTGNCGMGALEFAPATKPEPSSSHRLKIDQLVELASNTLNNRVELQDQLNFDDLFTEQTDDTATLSEILQVGTSAGGARAKAVIGWNPKTQELCSGQIDTEGTDFEHWLLKFDGVASNKNKENNDKGLHDPTGYTVREYAYSHMAKAAGIEMMPCKLLEENGRHHFLTQRFDRSDTGEKIHMQSLCAIAHLDFNMVGHHSYEQCFLVMRQLKLSMYDIEQQFRRMVYNIIACNQNDHVKNIAFLMNKRGQWKLSPAFDITYSHNPTGRYTSSHQMSMNGKTDSFTLKDFEKCAKAALMKRGRAKTIVQEVTEAVSQWKTIAKDADVEQKLIKETQKSLRLKIA